MKINLAEFEYKYSKLSNIELEKIILTAERLNPELISILINETKKRNLTYLTLESLQNEYKSKGFPNYFSTIEKDDIIKFITILKEKLPNKPTKNNYQLTHKMINAEYNITQNIQEKLQQISDIMREHLQINEPIKIITISNVDAGKFEMIDNLNCIFINNDISKQDFFQKVAILAHEMSHYYLIRKHNILLNDEKENEFLTELNAIFVGFGFLMLKGYKEKKTQIGNVIHKSTVGYININTIKETIIQTAYIRKQKPQWIIENVGFGEKLFFFCKTL
jgi:hypothetical protein